MQKNALYMFWQYRMVRVRKFTPWRHNDIYCWWFPSLKFCFNCVSCRRVVIRRVSYWWRYIAIYVCIPALVDPSNDASELWLISKLMLLCLTTVQYGLKYFPKLFMMCPKRRRSHFSKDFSIEIHIRRRFYFALSEFKLSDPSETLQMARHMPP